MLLAFGIFTYVRVTSFVNESFSGRNEASLLPPTPTNQPTRTPAADRSPQPALNRTPLPAIATATPRAAFPAAPTLTAAPTATAQAANLPAIVQKIKRGEPLTLMLMGYGGAGHDGAYLTDTIMLMTYDPTKNAVTMVNLPRDLYVFVPYGGPRVGYWGKINSAFSYVMEGSSSANLSSRYRFTAGDTKSKVDAAVNLTKDVVEQVTGTVIDYWATLSFDGFRSFIDAIGGVEVNVETAFHDYEYPANDDPSIDPSVMHVYFPAGRQIMTGEKAIQYARSRKSAQDGGDFSRSKRQMKLVAAVKERVVKPEIMLKAFGLMDALQGSIRTSLSLGEARALLDYYRGEGATGLGNLFFVSQVLSTDNFLSAGTSGDGAYILSPTAGQGRYAAIQEWLIKGRQYPELRAESMRVQIQNGSGQSYFLDKLNTELEESGFNLVEPVWARATTSTVILDYSNGKATNTLKALESLVPGVSVQTVKKPTGQLADVVLLLGRDYLQFGSGGSTNPDPTSRSVNIPAERTATPTVTP